MRAVNYPVPSPGVTGEIGPLGESARVIGSHEGGQSLIEFALVVPILMLIVMGIFTFGFTFNHKLMLTDAVAVGGRSLAISRGATADPCKDTANVVYGVAPLLTHSQMTFTFVLSGTSFPFGMGVAPTCAAGAADLTQGGTAQVTATYPCQLSIYGVNYAPSCLLTSQTSEVIQ